MKRRTVNILCVQETRWRGNKAKELGEGYKLYCSGVVSGGNGVGIVESHKIKEVKRGDRLTTVRLV